MVDTPLSTYPDRVLTDLLGHDALNRVGKLDVSALRPSGPDTSVQFNDGGVLGGDSGLVWDETNNNLTIADGGGFGWGANTRFQRIIGGTGGGSVNGSVSLGSVNGPFGIGSASFPDYAAFQVVTSGNSPWINFLTNAANSDGVWFRSSSTGHATDPFIKQAQVAANSDVLYWDIVAAHEESSGFWSWNGIGLLRYSVDGTPGFGSLPSRFRLYTNSGKDGFDVRMDLRADGTNMFSSVITTGATQNSLTPVMVLQKRTDGTPGVGTGIDLRFNVDTAAGNTETGANIQVVTTDITAASEDFDIVFKTMAAGAAAAERARLTSGSEFKLTHSSGNNGTLGWFSGPGGPEIALSSSGKISFHPSGTETLRLTDLGSGKGAGVSIGDSHESFPLAGSFARLAIFSDYNATTNMHIHLAGKDRHGPWIQTTANGHATSYTTKDFMQDGDYVFALTMLSATTGSFEGASSIECKVDGTTALGVMPCKLVFNVNSGHAGYEERFVLPALGVNKLGFNSWTNTNQIHNALKLWHLTHSPPANGIGVSLSFETTTSHSPTPYNQEIGGVIESLTTDVTLGSEDFDMVFKTMAGGATAAERLRVNSTGILVPASAYANFGTVQGTSGYGIRDNAGNIEIKNSGGSWAAPGGGGLPLIGTGATITADAPLLDLSQTWNASGVAFTAMKLNVTNTASAASSKLMDLQIGGTSRLRYAINDQPNQSALIVSGPDTDRTNIRIVNSTGYTFTFFSTGSGNSSPNTFGVFDDTDGVTMMSLKSNVALGMPYTQALAWSSGSFPPASLDLYLYRQGAGILGQANLGNAQSFRVYNTTNNNTSPLHYERGVFDWSTTSNVLTIGAQAGGTGTLRPVNVMGSTITLKDGSTGGFEVSGSASYWGAVSNSWSGGSPNAYVGIGAIGSYAGLYLRSDMYLGFVAANNINTNPDVAWTRGNAAGIMGLINALSLTSSTSLYVYNTVDNPASPTNYERGVFDWKTTSNTLTIGTQKGGSGTNRHPSLVSATGYVTCPAQFAANEFFGNAAAFLAGGAYWSITSPGSNTFNLAVGGANAPSLYGWSNSSVATWQFGSGNIWGWASTTDASSSNADTGISRSAAGVIAFGSGLVVGDASATIKAKTKAGAPVAADIPAGTWAVIRDTSGSTTKLYYNNAGTLMSVALA